MHFDCALHTAAYISQNMMPQRSGCTCQYRCLLHWLDAYIRWENNRRPVCGIKKKHNGTQDHQNCSNRIKVLMGVGTIGLLGFSSVFDRRLIEVYITLLTNMAAPWRAQMWSLLPKCQQTNHMWPYPPKSVSLIVSWCFEPSQPRRITSGLSHWYFSWTLDFYILVKSIQFPLKWYQNYANLPTDSKVIDKSTWLP